MFPIVSPVVAVSPLVVVVVADDVDDVSVVVLHTDPASTAIRDVWVKITM